MRRRMPRWIHALAAVAMVAASLAGAGVPGAARAGAAPAAPAGGGDVSVAAAPITNPVLWEDLADIDIFRVDNTFYYSASIMHYSPGAPILRSFDLVNWEFAGHSVPRLDFGSKYDLNGGRGYVRGIWASFLNFRRSNNTFYWGGCVDFAQTHIYGLSQVGTQQVFQTPSSIGTLEGARFYKRNGAYYIFLTRPANGQYILKSTSGPFGPYTIRQLLLNLPGPIPGGGVPHQGGLVQTQNGDWYYMAFVDAYPGGRVPVLAPITWTADGWPVLQLVNGAWGTSYPPPNLPPPPRAVKPPTGTDTFTTMGPEWEWNHNPDNTRTAASACGRTPTTTTSAPRAPGRAR
jgi:beta-xylosidase